MATLVDVAFLSQKLSRSEQLVFNTGFLGDAFVCKCNNYRNNIPQTDVLVNVCPNIVCFNVTCSPVYLMLHTLYLYVYSYDKKHRQLRVLVAISLNHLFVLPLPP